MNRTGLCIALGLAAIFVIVFGLDPRLDLVVAGWFYDPVGKDFPVRLGPLAAFARDAAMWIAWAFVAPSIVAVVVKFIRPLKPLMVPGRTVAVPGGDHRPDGGHPQQSRLQEPLGPAASGHGHATSAARGRSSPGTTRPAIAPGTARSSPARG